jgi:hypothetical protein
MKINIDIYILTIIAVKVKKIDIKNVYPPIKNIY